MKHIDQQVDRFNHVISYAVDATDRYSDSTDDCETISCFFDFQKIGLFPMKMQ